MVRLPLPFRLRLTSTLVFSWDDKRSQASRCAEGSSVFTGLAAALTASCCKARIRSSTCRTEGNTVVIDQRTLLRKCHTEADRYPDYKAFARALNKAYANTVVLKHE